MRHFGKILWIPPVLLIVLVLFLFCWQPGLLESFEAKTYDWRLRVWRGPVAQTGTFAIVAIDDKSIAELGRFPWSRKLFADLIDKATAAGAKGLVFDILFPEPEGETADKAFAAAISRSGKVTLSGAFDLAPDGTPSNFLRNIPELQAAASQIAHINIFPDEDGVLRWTRLSLPLAEQSIPSLAYAAALTAIGASRFETGDFFLKSGDLRIPTDGDHTLLINHRGPPGTFEHFSFADVLFGRVPEAALRGQGPAGRADRHWPL